MINKMMINQHHVHDDQEPWVESAIFWIEGVATPGVSLGGFLGEDFLFMIMFMMIIN